MKLYNADIDENDMDDMTIAEKVAEIQTNPDIVMMPLYIYDHSGIALYVGAPGDGCDHWDTSMIGWAVIEKKDVLKIGITEDHWNAEFIEKAIEMRWRCIASTSKVKPSDIPCTKRTMTMNRKRSTLAGDSSATTLCGMVSLTAF